MPWLNVLRMGVTSAVISLTCQQMDASEPLCHGMTASRKQPYHLLLVAGVIHCFSEGIAGDHFVLLAEFCHACSAALAPSLAGDSSVVVYIHQSPRACMETLTTGLSLAPMLVRMLLKKGVRDAYSRIGLRLGDSADTSLWAKGSSATTCCRAPACRPQGSASATPLNSCSSSRGQADLACAAVSGLGRPGTNLDIQLSTAGLLLRPCAPLTETLYHENLLPCVLLLCIADWIPLQLSKEGFAATVRMDVLHNFQQARGCLMPRG